MRNIFSDASFSENDTTNVSLHKECASVHVSQI